MIKITNKHLSILDVAEIAHEVNRIYCKKINDPELDSWDRTPDNIKASAVDGVFFHLNNPDALPSASHENWLKFKEKDGWKYGEVKDAEKKTHPCFIPFEQLPLKQQVKDSLFKAVVNSLAPITYFTKQATS